MQFLDDMRNLNTLLLATLLLTAAAPARAAQPWTPRLSLGTDFPIATSARVQVDTPFRLELGGSVGTLPGVYADFINNLAVSMGGYDEDTAEIVRKSLRSSLVISASAGYRLVSRLSVHADYSIVTLGGATTTPDVVASVAGVPLPFGSTSRDVTVSSTLQMAGIGVSWPFALTDAVRLRLGLGGRFTVAASTTVESSGGTQQDRDNEREAEQRLNDIYTSYAHTPVVSLFFEYGF